MAGELTGDAVAEFFTPMFLEEQQNKARLAGTHVVYNDNTGKMRHIPVVEPVELDESDFDGADIPVARRAHREVAVTPKVFNKKLVIGDAGATLYNFDEVAAQARQCAIALGRQEDAEIIRAITSRADQMTSDYDGKDKLKNVVNPDNSSAPVLNIEQLIAITGQLEDNAGDPMMSYLMVDQPVYSHILTLQQYTSKFYQNNTPLYDGPKMMENGIRNSSIITMPRASLKNQLPQRENGRYTMWCFDYNSVGMMYNVRPRCEVVRDAGNARTAVIPYVVLGAAVLRNSGVISSTIKLK